MTVQTLQVLQTMLVRPNEEHYGLAISERTRLPTGSIYPIMTRLETAGWVTSAWEDIDESAEGRRKRRYYQLTQEGASAAHSEISKMRQRLAPVEEKTRPDWRPAAPEPGWGPAV
ncbi:PadR family transcriptional regulator [Nocardia sp. XZ_19_385]|uniref:PadR family transcriptional regulator n=1 Tax=Nocardia sp. XZ_19_385 TaxID=2769488 RepID=UPI001E31D98C|nr:PadR family transcriptional regulator [Nocardia sp. XZ_19_385]